MQIAGEALSALMVDLEKLQEQIKGQLQFGEMEKRITKIKVTTNEAKKQHLQSASYLRQVTQALHQVAENLATQEIDINPKGFVGRETIQRSQKKQAPKGWLE